MVWLAGTALVLGEGFLVLCFGVGLFGNVIGVAGALFFLLLAAASGSVMARGIHTSCSCFSLEGNEAVGPHTVVRAVLLACVSSGVALLTVHPYPESALELAPAILLLAPIVGWGVGRYRVRRAEAFASIETASA